MARALSRHLYLFRISGRARARPASAGRVRTLRERDVLALSAKRIFLPVLCLDPELLPDKPAIPFVPVSDMVGEIVAVGADVTRFEVGDWVLGNFWTQWIDGEPPREMTRHGLSLGGPLPKISCRVCHCDDYDTGERSFGDEACESAVRPARIFQFEGFHAFAAASPLACGCLATPTVACYWLLRRWTKNSGFAP
jgi:hypothetical protein